MKNFVLRALLLGLSAEAVAEEEGGSAGAHWALGVGAAITASPYAGEGTRFTPIPLVIYESESVFFRGTTLGWNLYEKGPFDVAAILALRLDGMDAKDFGRKELAENGIDRSLLEDRDDGLDAGLSATWRGAAGELKVDLLADVSDASDGQSIAVEYGYPLSLGQTRLTPNLGATWLSKDMANYYYGTLDKEVDRGVIDYKPGAVTIPHIGLTATRALGKKWSTFASIKYSPLPDDLKDSPLVDADSDSMTSVRLGITRSF